MLLIQRIMWDAATEIAGKSSADKDFERMRRLQALQQSWLEQITRPVKETGELLSHLSGGHVSFRQDITAINGPPLPHAIIFPIFTDKSFGPFTFRAKTTIQNAAPLLTGFTVQNGNNRPTEYDIEAPTKNCPPDLRANLTAALENIVHCALASGLITEKSILDYKKRLMAEHVGNKGVPLCVYNEWIGRTSFLDLAASGRIKRKGATL